MMPSCDQIGVPIHFHSSTTSGSASLMSLRILLRVFPRQSPSSAILFEMSTDADWPWLVPGFFMFTSWCCFPSKRISLLHTKCRHRSTILNERALTIRAHPILHLDPLQLDILLR